MDQLVKLYKDSHLGRRLPAYDGRKSLYTAGPLPFTSREFVITLVDEDDGQGGPRYIRFFDLYTFLHFYPSLFVIFCMAIFPPSYNTITQARKAV